MDLETYSKALKKDQKSILQKKFGMKLNLNEAKSD